MTELNINLPKIEISPDTKDKSIIDCPAQAHFLIQRVDTGITEVYKRILRSGMVNVLWGILIAVGAGWFGVNILMPKPNLASRAQRLTIIAVGLAYGFFALVALVNGLDNPSGFSLTRFLIEGVLFGAIVGLVTYGLAQTIHWAIKGQTMKGTSAQPAKKVRLESQHQTLPKKQELVSTAAVNSLLGAFGITGNVLMNLTFQGVNEWSFLFGYGMIIPVAWGVLVKKHRSPWWLLVCIIPIGWIILLVLKNRGDSNTN